jgi:hypothetical protein
MNSSILISISRIILTIGIALLLWVKAARASLAQGGIFAVLQATRAVTEPGSSRTLTEALRSAGPRLRLNRMDDVGARWPPEGLHNERSLAARESLGIGSVARIVLERLTRPGPRRAHVLDLAKSAATLMDAPNRALCRLAGADRAHINWSKKRVSFTWFVSLP